MSKYNIKDLWDIFFGNAKEVRDYAGRKIMKSACGNPKSGYFPTIEHIRPLSQGGLDVLENIIICHCDTNEEKANNFPNWKANGKRFHAQRVKGSSVEYEIYLD